MHCPFIHIRCDCKVDICDKSDFTDTWIAPYLSKSYTGMPQPKLAVTAVFRFSQFPKGLLLLLSK